MTIVQAARLLAQRRLDEAEALCHLVRPGAAGFPLALHHLGIIALLRGNPGRAEELIRRSLRLAPAMPDALNDLGLALGAQGKLNEAARCFERASRPHASKRSASAAQAPLTGLYRLHAYLGRALMDAGEVTAATAVLARALVSLVRGEAPTGTAGPAPAKRHPVALYPEAVRVVSERLAANGIEAFLVGGTLLGLVRDGGFLPFDKDVDFGVDAAVTPADLLAAFADDRDFAPSYGTDADAVLTGFRFKGEVAIDFFRFFRQGEHVWCGLARGGHLMKWLHRPFTLAETRLDGATVRIPADAETFLAECYGDGWRKPDPYFGLFASPNIEGGFPPLSRCIAYRAMLRAAIAGDRARLQALCRQIQALAPADEVARAVTGWLNPTHSPSPWKWQSEGAGDPAMDTRFRWRADTHRRIRKLPSRRRWATRSMICRVETPWE